MPQPVPRPASQESPNDDLRRGPRSGGGGRAEQEVMLGDLLRKIGREGKEHGGKD